EYDKKFCKQFALFLGLRYALLVNSGSSANLLAISALCSPLLGEKQLKPGDEVITLAAGFPTTVNPIILNNLVPVFVDISLGTYDISLEEIKKAMSHKTKAIFVAHTLGMPFALDSISAFARENGLFLIEDCCDALGSTYDGKYAGTFGDIATFSFYPAHHITMGEGGAVVTDKPLLKKILESLRDWGRSCFPGGVKINVRESLKNIEDVQVGDLVYTHNGVYLKVTKLTGREYSGQMYHIKAGNAKRISVTSDHPFYIIRDGKFQWVNSNALIFGDYLLESIPHKDVPTPKGFCYSYNTAYKREKVRIPITPDLMRLIGYWLAEGSVSLGLKGKSGYKENKYKYYRVEFSFHSDEKKYIDDVCQLMHKIFGISGVFLNRKKGFKGVSLQFKTRKGYEFFSQIFNTGASNKSLPDHMVNWKFYGCISELVLGYWRGDGSIDSQGIHFGSTSEILIQQIRRILLRQQISGSYYERKPENHTSSIVNNKQIKAKHTLFQIKYYGKMAEKISTILGLNFIPRKENSNHKAQFISHYVAYPIENIEKEYVNDVKVYNMEVENDHSYHAGFFAVHNCWCSPG
ncbi:MAG: DegT/DnrJ/EryC1/StrS family aminotransferase, partial [Nanoarchaeota archaeon]